MIEASMITHREENAIVSRIKYVLQVNLRPNFHDNPAL
jgi:hypothetical protein